MGTTVSEIMAFPFYKMAALAASPQPRHFGFTNMRRITFEKKNKNMPETNLCAHFDKGLIGTVKPKATAF